MALFAKLFKTKQAQLGSVVPALPASSASDDMLDFLHNSAKQPAHEKTFDWFHYQMNATDSGMFGAEFASVLPSAEVFKLASVREPSLSRGIQAITRQFQSVSFAVSNTSQQAQQLDKSHPVPMALKNSIQNDSAAAFHQTMLHDLIVTGNAFAWITESLDAIVWLPSERIERVYVKGVLQCYKYIRRQGDPRIFTPDEIIDCKLPNPFSSQTGLSLLVSMLLQILIDKYGHEWVIGFFLRGGSTSATLQADTAQVDVITRLYHTIQQMVGSRRNMHADKMLPKGVSVVAPGQKFSDVQIIELLKENARKVWGTLGVPPVAVGDTDGVNYATADQQMKFFWEGTIVPLQTIYASCLARAPRIKKFLTASDVLVIDNSENKWLSDFEQKLTQDTKLAQILTINERRKRIGYDPMADGDKIANSGPTAPQTLSLLERSIHPDEAPISSTEPPEPEFGEDSPWAGELPGIIMRLGLDEPATDPIKVFFDAQFIKWEEALLERKSEPAQASRWFKGQAPLYGKDWGKVAIDDAMEAWQAQAQMLTISTDKSNIKSKRIINKDENFDAILAALYLRSQEFLEGRIAADGATSFVGFTETMTARFYAKLQKLLEDGVSLAESDLILKQWFREYYEGQFKTIINTEYRSALNTAQARFGTDLSTQASKMRKTWMAKIDSATRDPHKALDNKSISGDAKKVMERSFLNSETLRFPMDSKASASQTINCRCTIRYTVLEWGEE